MYGKRIMKTTAAFLIQEYSEEEKKLITLIGGLYSFSCKGYFLTEEQKAKLDGYIEDPSTIPVPSVATPKGNGVFVDDLIDSWKVHGDTFAKKDALKNVAKGFVVWSNSDKSWRIPKEKATREQIENVFK